MFDFAGIKRNTEFSPNHRGTDNAIFTLTAAELIKMDCLVNIYSEEEFLSMEQLQEEEIFTMARNKKTVAKLQQEEAAGKLVINSGFGIEQCYRTNMTLGLVNQQIPYPESLIVPTDLPADKAFAKLGGKNFWIKRGDFHAIHKEDVTFAPTACHGADILEEYSLRGISEAVISRHLFGDLVKFYGVRGTDFFYWFYPTEFNHSKFNAEAINGAANYFPFDEAALKQIGHQAAEALNVFIYGGDAIISAKGDIHIIDLNDWPSFAPCRNEAAIHIARCIYEQALQHSTILSTT